MNFLKFSKILQPQKVFSTTDVEKEWPNFNFTNLVNWQDKGYLIKLRNSWYAFPDTLKTETDLFFLANRLHRPSYVSLETALRWYNFIPESVFTITSVTTLKPTEYRTPVGHFAYRALKSSFFFGYQVSETTPAFLMAYPEKALLDMLYFSPQLSTVSAFTELRLNQEEIARQFNNERMENYLCLFDSPTLEKRWQNMKKHLAL